MASTRSSDDGPSAFTVRVPGSGADTPMTEAIGTLAAIGGEGDDPPRQAMRGGAVVWRVGTVVRGGRSAPTASGDAVDEGGKVGGEP